MRIAYLVASLDDMGGAERSVTTQANALAGAHDVQVVSLVQRGDRPWFDLDPRVRVDYLTRDLPDRPAGVVQEGLLDDTTAARLAQAPSLLVPPGWDARLSALGDVALEAFLPALEADVLVTTTPGLLAAAAQLAPPGVALVHQEHRSIASRTAADEALLAFGPRADTVALLTPDAEAWLAAQLGQRAPQLVVVPNPIPTGFLPRSPQTEPVVVAAGRITEQKQFLHLVTAFGTIKDEIPEWRLRILGAGDQVALLKRQVRKSGLWDRVELPGPAREMRSEWARASVAALTSRDEGLPLALQEAMAAGLAVAAYDCVTGPRDLVEHEVSGLLVPPGSVTGMAAALLRLATDADLRRRLGEGAVAATRPFAPEAVASRWVEVFSAAVERRGRGVGRVGHRAVEAALSPAPRREEPVRAPSHVTPESARAEILAGVVDAAAAAGDGWFVLPSRTAAGPTVVLPMALRDPFLERLEQGTLPSYVSLLDPENKGWPARRGAVQRLARRLRRGRTPRVVLEPWPSIPGPKPAKDEALLLGQGCAVVVEFWEEDRDGGLVAPGLNGLVKRVPPGTLRADTTLHGVTVPALAFLSGRLVDELTEPVDFVFTWVDGADPAWNEARERRLRELGGERGPASAGRARFESRDELRYALRSVHLFAPWARRIHLVTAGQVPPWLDPTDPRIALVDHREILPEDALPTFNSHAIETALHRVPGLTEHFVYCNDDMFLGRPVTPRLFFTGAGAPAVFLSDQPLGAAEPDAPEFLQAGWHNRRLLEERLGVTITATHTHSPYPHRRSILADVEETFADEVARTVRSPFRSGTDVSMLSSLAQHYGLATGRAVPGHVEGGYVSLGVADLDRRFRGLRRREQDYFCLGDDHTYATPPRRLREQLGEFLEWYFPVPAPWEADRR